MFSFFDKMSKAREEWLKTPRPTPQRAVYLNALAKTKLEAKDKRLEANKQTNILIILYR
jgi:hypothetical protein